MVGAVWQYRRIRDFCTIVHNTSNAWMDGTEALCAGRTIRGTVTRYRRTTSTLLVIP